MIKAYSTNQNGCLLEKEIIECDYISGATQLNLSDIPVNLGFLGFGVAITGSSCYLLNQMPSEERKRLLTDIYSKDGLNLNVARISIGSSDYSAELYTYCDKPFDVNLEGFSVKRDEKYIIPIIKEILEIKPDLFILASPWSPPAWMKTGGSICGGYMRNSFVECYADYIVRFIKAYAEYGIKISAITPQNEPETHQSGLMPACMWHPETEAKFICILKRRLKENGLDTQIWMHDHNFSDVGRVEWELDNIEGLSDACDGVAFHYYSGNIEQTAAFGRKYPDKKLHFTEGGPRLYDNYGTDWCKWAIMMTKVLGCGYSSFTGWNLMLDQTGNPNIGPFFCGGLITKDSVTSELTYSGQYKAFRHIARHIDRQTEIYAIKSDGTELASMSEYPNEKRAVMGFVAKKGEKKAAVLINPEKEKRQTQLNLFGKRYYIELLADSVCTIEF